MLLSANSILLRRTEGRFDVCWSGRDGTYSAWQALNVEQARNLLELLPPALVTCLGMQPPRLLRDGASRSGHLFRHYSGRAAPLTIMEAAHRFAFVGNRGVPKCPSKLLDDVFVLQRSGVDSAHRALGKALSAALIFSGDLDHQIGLSDATLDSLSTFWRVGSDLHLHIVAAEQHLAQLERDLIRVPNVRLSFEGSRSSPDVDASSRLLGCLVQSVANGEVDYSLCLEPGDFLASRITESTVSRYFAEPRRASSEKMEAADGRQTGEPIFRRRTGQRSAVHRHVVALPSSRGHSGPFILSREVAWIVMEKELLNAGPQGGNIRSTVQLYMQLLSRNEPPSIQQITSRVDVERLASQHEETRWSFEGAPVIASLPIDSASREQLVSLLYLLLPQ